MWQECASILCVQVPNVESQRVRHELILRGAVVTFIVAQYILPDSFIDPDRVSFLSLIASNPFIFLISVICFLENTGLSPVFHKNSVILWFPTAKQRRLKALKLPALRAVVARPDAEKRQGFLLLLFRRLQIGLIFGHPARSSIHGASPPSGQNTLQ